MKIFLIILLLSTNLFAQILGGSPAIEIINASDKSIVSIVKNEAYYDSLLVTLDGFMPKNITASATSNITLESDVELLSDTNRFFTSGEQGDWSLVGSGSLTVNTDSSATYYDSSGHIEIPITTSLNQGVNISFGFEEGETDLVTSFQNGSSYPYETFTSSGSAITSAINTTGFGGLASNLIKASAQIGDVFKVVVTGLTKNSGTYPTISFVNSVLGAAARKSNVFTPTSNGDYQITLTVTAISNIYLEISVGNGIATDFSISDISVYQVNESQSVESAKLIWSYGNSTDSTATVTSGRQDTTFHIYGTGADTLKVWSKYPAKLKLYSFSVKELPYNFKLLYGESKYLKYLLKSNVVGTFATNTITINSNTKQKTVNVPYSVYSLSVIADNDSIIFNNGNAISAPTEEVIRVTNESTQTLYISSAFLPGSYSSIGYGTNAILAGSYLDVYFACYPEADTTYSETTKLFIGTTSGATSFVDTLSFVYYAVTETNSNTLILPKYLSGMVLSSGNLITFVDENIPDTSNVIDYSFSASSSDFSYLSQAHDNSFETVDSLDGYLTVIDQYSGSWPASYLFYKILPDSTYKIKTDALKGTSNSIWLTVQGYSANAPVFPYLYNQEAFQDTTFDFTFTNTSAYDSIKIAMQIYSTANGKYGKFDNLVVTTNVPSWDKWQLASQTLYEVPAYGLTPYDNFSILAEGIQGTSYMHLASSMNFFGTDSAVYVYKARFIKNEDTTLWSDLDTITFKYEIVTSVEDTANVDYFIASSGSGTFLNNDYLNPIPIDHFLTYKANADSISTNKKVFIKETLQWRFADDAQNTTAFDFSNLPDYTTLVLGSNVEITAEDTLYKGMDSDSWVYDTGQRASLGGIYPWKYRFDDYYSSGLLARLEATGYGYFALDSVYYPFYLNPNWDASQSGASDSAFYRPCTDYPYSLRQHSNGETNTLYVYTGSNTIKPSEQFTSMLTMGNVKFLAKFANTDHLTLKGGIWKGGWYNTISFDNCSYLEVSKIDIRKGQYRNLELFDCAYVVIDSSNFDAEYTTFGGGKIYYEFFSFQGAIQPYENCHDIEIKNSNFIGQTSSGFTAVAQANAPYNLFVHDNFFSPGGKGILPYYRPYQIANDFSYTTPSYVVDNFRFYNNEIKFATIPIKLLAKNEYHYFNIYDSCGTNVNAMWDHGAWKYPISNQPIFTLEKIVLYPNIYPNTTVKYFFNNTFLNNDESLFQSINSLVKNFQWKVFNNAFINQSILTADNYKGAIDDNTYGAYHLDFTIYNSSYDATGRGVWDVRNNYHYNEYTSIGDKVVIYGGIGSAPYLPNYLTWTELNSADTGGDVFDGNIEDYSSSLIENIIDVTNNYEPTSVLQNNGYNSTSIKSILGANFRDRFGNLVTDASGNFISTVNIGASNKK